MGSIVLNLQEDIAASKKSATEILRTAKLISAKLDLSDISSWIDLELNGYGKAKVPHYRMIKGGQLQYFNPYHGWLSAGFLDFTFPVTQSIPTIEELVSERSIVLPLSQKIPLTSFGGYDDELASKFDQRVSLPVTPFKTIMETVKDQILNWTTELEKRGILGEGMSFNKEEKRSAHNQVFHIQNATGVFGNVQSSSVQIYDYSAIHQTLKEAGVPQSERNELENILDELPEASGDQKKTLLERGKAWIVKNKEFLGAGIDLVKKALGVDS